MRLGVALLLLACLACKQCAAKRKPCPNAFRALALAGPKHAEVLAVARAVRRLVPNLESSRFDVEAPANWLTLQQLARMGIKLGLARPAGKSKWTPAELKSMANFIKLLLVPKAKADRQCPRVRPLSTRSALRKALMPKPGGRALLAASTQQVTASAASSGAWGPIYVNSAQNNNTGAIGTGYNILLAGPNAFSASLSGLDPGLLFSPIFSTNLGFNLGQANAFLCSDTVDVTYSASATQQNTSVSLGASGTYEGVTASANTQFGYNMNQQSGSGSAATLYQCNADAFSYNLRSFSNAGPSALDTNFLASTMALIKAGVAAGFQFTVPAFGAQLASYVAAYGTHYLTKGYSGGVTSQSCLMSTYTYAYAMQSGWSFSANLAAASDSSDSVSGSGGSNSGTSTQFDQANAHCSYVQSPGSIQLVVNSNGQPNIAQWLDNLIQANTLMPSGYSLGALTNLFAFPKLFGNAFSASVLQSMGTTLQAYILQCAPGNTNGIACATFSPNCAAQTYLQGSQCLSCYTTGPLCSGLNSQINGGAFSSCTASTCNCNSPWTGPQCSQGNVGTCYAAKHGPHECTPYEFCCAPGYLNIGQQSKNTGDCGCQCVPANAAAENGLIAQGCGTNFGQLCGTCSGCVNTQVSPYGGGCAQ